jgi:hypothetical protein
VTRLADGRSPRSKTITLCSRRSRRAAHRQLAAVASALLDTARPPRLRATAIPEAPDGRRPVIQIASWTQSSSSQPGRSGPQERGEPLVFLSHTDTRLGLSPEGRVRVVTRDTLLRPPRPCGSRGRGSRAA